MIVRVRKRPRSSAGKLRGCIYTNLPVGSNVILISVKEYRKIQFLLDELKGNLYERSCT